MLRDTRLTVLAPTVVLLVTGGCTPSAETGTAANRASAGNVAARNAKADEALSADPPVKNKRADQRILTEEQSIAKASVMPIVEVKNPLYSTYDPVFYDSGSEKDNSSCLVCHSSFEKELISAKHVEAGVTCAACHGDSQMHRADQTGITSPDVVWGRAEMQPFCRQCHFEHEHPNKVRAFMAQWEGKRRPNGRWIGQNSVCTDCHGMHAIVAE